MDLVSGRVSGQIVDRVANAISPRALVQRWCSLAHGPTRPVGWPAFRKNLEAVKIVELERYKQGWEDIGKLDPLWAVLTEPSGRCGRWDQEAFFRTGAEEIGRVMEEAAKLGYPRQRGSGS